ncbi:hypothetical protein [Mycobacterium sp. E802]|uniref:hypothetical protein n=1 Tax=Mycobacterium sp. E802 TaxID=1834152 RepID=UPI0012F81091|nr:hypothetical protein [Mycobacterium sp. E802]
MKALLGREALEGAAGITSENALPKALVAAEARADDAAGNLTGRPPVDPPESVLDHPSPAAGEHTAPPNPVADHSPTFEHHPAPIGDDVSFADPSRPMLGSDDRYHIPEGATEIQIDQPGNLGTTITDIDRVENGVLWEEKSATSAGNVEQWVNKQFVNKMEKYIESQQYIAGYEKSPIGVRFTNPGGDPALRTAIEQAAADLRVKYTDATILVDWAP